MKFKNEQELINVATIYFGLCDKNRQKPEKAGLCLALGINRSTYNDYKKKYPNALKGIELYIESAWVRRLDGQAATGAIFYLKNAFREDYKDRTETDITSGGKPIPILGGKSIKK